MLDDLGFIPAEGTGNTLDDLGFIPADEPQTNVPRSSVSGSLAEDPGIVSEFLKGLPRGASRVASGAAIAQQEISDLIRRYAPFLPGAIPGALGVGDAARSAQEFVDRTFPRDERAGLSADLGEGFGQVGAMMAGGIGLRAMGATPLAAQLLTGAAGSGAEFTDAFDRAIERGDDPDTAFAKALGYSTVATAIEQRFGAGRLVRRLADPAMVRRLADRGVSESAIAQFLGATAKDAGVNFVEEATQRIAQDLIVEGETVPGPVLYEGTLGAIIGGTLGIPGNVPLLRRRRRGQIKGDDSPSQPPVETTQQQERTQDGQEEEGQRQRQDLPPVLSGSDPDQVSPPDLGVTQREARREDVQPTQEGRSLKEVESFVYDELGVLPSWIKVQESEVTSSGWTERDGSIVINAKRIQNKEQLRSVLQEELLHTVRHDAEVDRAWKSIISSLTPQQIAEGQRLYPDYTQDIQIEEAAIRAIESLTLNDEQRGLWRRLWDAIKLAISRIPGVRKIAETFGADFTDSDARLLVAHAWRTAHLPAYVRKLQQEFPSAPPIEVNPSASGVELVGDRIRVAPGTPRSKVRSDVLAIMAERGLNLLPPTAWQDLYKRARLNDAHTVDRTARQIKADTSTPEGQEATAKALMKSYRDEGREWAIDALMRGLGASGNRKLRRLLKAQVEAVLDAYRVPPADIRPGDQRQVFADLNAGAWEMRSWIRSLHSLAGELDRRSLEHRLFAQLHNHLKRLADAGRARQIARNQPDKDVELSISSAEFLDHLEELGIEVSERDREAHERYRNELAARSVVKLREQLSSHKGVRDRMVAMVPDFDPSDLNKQILRIEKRLAKFNEDIHARADALMESYARVPQAKAAQRVLADPQIVQWTEIITRIEDSGLAPRSIESLPPNLQDAARYGVSRFNQEFLAFQERIAARGESFWPAHKSKLRALKDRLRNAQSNARSREIAIHDIIEAQAGELGLSGSLASRSAEKHLRDNIAILTRMMQELGKIDPDINVQRVRDALLAGEPLYGGSVNEAARAVGVSEEALLNILRLTRTSQEFRHAVVDIYNAASRAAQNAVITAIEEIESALAKGDSKAASEIADRAIARQRAAWKRWVNLEEGLGRDIDALEVDRQEQELLERIAKSIQPNLSGTRRMIYGVKEGQHFAGFDFPGGKQEAFTIQAGQQYTMATLKKIVQWQENAIQAVLGGGVDSQTIEGLKVALPISHEYVDSRFTPEQISKTLAPSRLLDSLGTGVSTLVRTKQILPALVHGLWGSRIASAERIYNRLSGQIENLIARSVAPRHKRMKAAAESLGLDLDGGDSLKLEAAYNEVAHRLRQHQSGVAVGDMLWSTGLQGKSITTELLTLIRGDRAIFKEAQKIAGALVYGGVRENLPGRQIVRPPVEVGDVGLARLPDRAKYEKLVPLYSNNKRTITEVIQFWNQDQDALRSHIRDAARNDTVIEREPAMREAEIQLANDIARGKQPFPATFDEWTAAIASRLPPMANQLSYAQDQLLAELEQYGRIAIERLNQNEQRSFNRPLDTVGRYFGESDHTEFTSAAAPLLFPSSWYVYGASDGLAQALERVIDQAQVEYVDALQKGARELNDTAREIQRLTATGQPLTPELQEIVRWHTNYGFPAHVMDARRIEAAVRRMGDRASVLTTEVGNITNPEERRSSMIIKGLQRLYAPLLTNPMTATGNIVGGPITSYFLSRRFYSSPVAAFIAAMDVGKSVLHAVYESAFNVASPIIAGIEQATGRPLTLRSEILSYMESFGIGSMYDRTLLGEMQTWARGHIARSQAQRALDATSQAFNVASQYVGVLYGDEKLNLFGARFVIPRTIKRLKELAIQWEQRTRGMQPSDPGYAFSRQDSSRFAEITDFLRAFGNPEEVLKQLASGDVNPRTFWRSELGSKIGDSILRDLNVASRTNRPQRNSVLGLFGWTSHVINMAALSTRTTGEAPRHERLARSISALAMFGVVSAAGYYAQALARRGVAESISSAFGELATILSGVPDDDEDDWMMFDWASDALARIVGLIRKVPGLDQLAGLAETVARGGESVFSPAHLPTPLDPGFFDRPVGEVAFDLAIAPFEGVGVNDIQLPVFSIAKTAISAGVQFSRGFQTALKSDRVSIVAGIEDMKDAIRKAAGLLGPAGRILAESTMPGTRATIRARNEIKNAAMAAGIYVEPYRGNTPTIPTHPARRVLEGLAVDLMEGDQNAARRINDLTSWLWTRAYDRAIERGASEADARKSADASIKSMLASLQPVEQAIGRAVTPEQWRKLEERLKGNARVARATKAHEALVRHVAANPPADMQPFIPTPAMLSPVKGLTSVIESRRRRTRASSLPRLRQPRRRRERSR